MTTLGEIERLAASQGLTVRGGFHPEPADTVPPTRPGQLAATLLLIGVVGRGSWAAFSSSPEFRDGGDHPLDRWSRRCIDGIAAATGGSPLYPFGGPPHLPFQRWALRAEEVHTSPLGLLIHPDHGLWHAYRGAIAFAERLDLPPRRPRESPCATCADRPCLTTCPVSAFCPAGYAVDSCAGYLETAAGTTCRSDGCLARRACPVGAGNRYDAAQQAFHMAAFLRARR